jgi:hypothetical protein
VCKIPFGGSRVAICRQTDTAELVGDFDVLICAVWQILWSCKRIYPGVFDGFRRFQHPWMRKWVFECLLCVCVCARALLEHRRLDGLCSYSVFSSLTVVGRFPINIVTCQRIASQRLDNHPAFHARNNRTAGLFNPFLGNGSVNILPCRQWRHATADRDHVTCFL